MDPSRRSGSDLVQDQHISQSWRCLRNADGVGQSVPERRGVEKMVQYTIKRNLHIDPWIPLPAQSCLKVLASQHLGTIYAF
jgi:hypothetical protein